MAKKLNINKAGLCADLLKYLRVPGFAYFQPKDVAHYKAQDMIVVVLTEGECATELIFNYAKGCVSTRDRCGTIPAHQRNSAFWDEMNAIGAEFAVIAAKHTTVQTVGPPAAP